MHYALIYEYAADYLERRGQFRNAHLAAGWAASERGQLVLGGAFAHPADGALLIFQGGSPSIAENFAAADPYVLNGLVKRWYVREWTTVVGDSASTPVRPPQPPPAG